MAFTFPPPVERDMRETVWMIAAVAGNLEQIKALCQFFDVRRLVVFGSASDDTFRPGESDVDFLVEFNPLASQSRFDAFFGLQEGLQAVLGSPVDLVSHAALNNPYFAASVEANHTEIYAA